MSDAARATSAAPTYFEAATLTTEQEDEDDFMLITKETMIDGGISANNPIGAARIRAHQLFPNSEIIFISLGTGQGAPQEIGHNAGLIEGGLAAITLYSEGQMAAADKLAKMENAPLNYFRFQIESNVELDETNPVILDDLEKKAKAETETPRFKALINRLAEIRSQEG